MGIPTTQGPFSPWTLFLPNPDAATTNVPESHGRRCQKHLPATTTNQKKSFSKIFSPLEGKTCPCLKQLDPLAIPSLRGMNSASLEDYLPPPPSLATRSLGRDRRLPKPTVSPPWSLKEQKLAVRLQCCLTGVVWALWRLGSKESHNWLWWGRSLHREDCKEGFCTPWLRLCRFLQGETWQFYLASKNPN